MTAPLARSDSAVKRAGGGILLNGPNSPPSQQSGFRPQPIRIPTESASGASTDTSMSPVLSSPDTSAASGEEGPTAPMKLRFSSPLPSSGKRSNSITLGVAARAQLLSQQNGGQPIQRVQVAPSAPSSNPWYQTGVTPPDVYTVADAKSGFQKVWRKVRRKKRSGSQGSDTSSASTVSTQSSLMEVVVPEEPTPTSTGGRGDATPGTRTPRGRESPRPEEDEEEDNTSGLVRRASADPDRPSKSKVDVLGFDAQEYQEPTHDHSTEYNTELWRQRTRQREESASSISEEDSRGSMEGESAEGGDADDDVEEEAEHVAAMNRKTSSAAGYEVVDRHKR